jgi:hypothetical protein
MNNLRNSFSKSGLWVFLMVLMSSISQAQLAGFEYFWNTDPGLGNGILVSFDVPQDEIIEAFDIPTTGLPQGRHILYTRALNVDGTYGITNSKEIYLVSYLAEGEYFWDVDPGQGNGTPLLVNLSDDSSQGCEHISTAGLLPGVHNLYVRTKNEAGTWSITRTVQIELTNTSPPAGCSGDYNYDGQVTTADLLILLGSFGTETCSVDLNGDQLVNISDMLIFLGAFGNPCL